MNKANIVLIVHDVRSAHNVGSMLRTANGLGLKHTYLSGYTPYPRATDDSRLPHISERATRQIHKTALGAEIMNSSHADDLVKLLTELRSDGYKIAALEQAESSKPLTALKNSGDIALIVGNEVGGIEPEILDLCDLSLEIPMLGDKESFNVSIAAAIALYHLRYCSLA